NAPTSERGERTDARSSERTNACSSERAEGRSREHSERTNARSSERPEGRSGGGLGLRRFLGDPGRPAPFPTPPHPHPPPPTQPTQPTQPLQPPQPARPAQSAPPPALRGEPPAGPAEKCEMCGTPVGGRHGHVVDVEHRSLMCACRPCFLLFTGESATGRF